jgi:hypothetical protein
MHVDLILTHAAERVVRVVGQPLRLRAVAVAAEIGTHDGEVLRKLRRDEVPRDVRQRVAVQQQNRRSFSADAADDLHFRVGRLNRETLEAFEHGSLLQALDLDRGRQRKKTCGSHVASGCIAFATAESLLAPVSGYRFTREPDPATGYRELRIGRAPPHELTRAMQLATRSGRLREPGEDLLGG